MLMMWLNFCATVTSSVENILCTICSFLLHRRKKCLHFYPSFLSCNYKSIVKTKTKYIFFDTICFATVMGRAVRKIIEFSKSILTFINEISTKKYFFFFFHENSLLQPSRTNGKCEKELLIWSISFSRIIFSTFVFLWAICSLFLQKQRHDWQCGGKKEKKMKTKWKQNWKVKNGKKKPLL